MLRYLNLRLCLWRLKIRVNHVTVRKQLNISKDTKAKFQLLCGWKERLKHIVVIILSSNGQVLIKILSYSWKISFILVPYDVKDTRHEHEFLTIHGDIDMGTIASKMSNIFCQIVIIEELAVPNNLECVKGIDIC